MADYSVASAPVQDNPIGLDKPLTNLQLELGTLPWLEISYGRVITTYNEQRKRVPTVMVGNRQHKIVLPNDNMKAQSFITTISPERLVEWNRGMIQQNKEVDIAIIFWMNFEKINPNVNRFFIEELKSDVENILVKSPNIQRLNNVIDDDARSIFRAFDIDVIGNECLMWPYGGLRFECTVGFETFCNN